MLFYNDTVCIYIFKFQTMRKWPYSAMWGNILHGLSRWPNAPTPFIEKSTAFSLIWNSIHTAFYISYAWTLFLDVRFFDTNLCLYLCHMQWFYYWGCILHFNILGVSVGVTQLSKPCSRPVLFLRIYLPFSSSKFNFFLTTVVHIFITEHGVFSFHCVI